MKTKITPEMEEQFIKDAEAALEAPRKDSKIRITTYLDGDVIDKLKLMAADEGHGKYQTTLNSFLRSKLFDEETPSKEYLAAKKILGDLFREPKFIMIFANQIKKIENTSESFDDFGIEQYFADREDKEDIA